MSEEQKNESGDDKSTSGSSDDLIQSGPDANNSGAGEPKEGAAQSNEQSDGGEKTPVIDPKEYEDIKTQREELEKKLGEQGSELGDLRTFIRNIEPVLDNLEKQPELLQALVDGKIDPQVAKSVLEGKLDADDAQKVTEAHDKVKKDMGDEKYEKADPKEVEAKVRGELSEEFDKKITSVKEELQKTLNDSNQLRDFKQDVDNFIENTKDFEDYAEGIAKWLEENPDQDDIKIAYKTVKADAILEKQKTDDDTKKAEAAKDVAANAAGGVSQNAAVIDDKDVIDNLVSGNPTPNQF